MRQRVRHFHQKLAGSIRLHAFQHFDAPDLPKKIGGERSTFPFLRPGSVQQFLQAVAEFRGRLTLQRSSKDRGNRLAELFQIVSEPHRGRAVAVLQVGQQAGDPFAISFCVSPGKAIGEERQCFVGCRRQGADRLIGIGGVVAR